MHYFIKGYSAGTYQWQRAFAHVRASVCVSVCVLHNIPHHQRPRRSRRHVTAHTCVTFLGRYNYGDHVDYISESDNRYCNVNVNNNYYY